MFWTVVDRIVNLTFLLLAILIITLLLNTSSASHEGLLFSEKLEAFRQETLKAMSNNVTYIETRINRVSENQDSYQVSSSSRMNVLDQRLSKLEADEKKNQRVVNVNNNTLTQTAYPTNKE